MKDLTIKAIDAANKVIISADEEEMTPNSKRVYDTLLQSSLQIKRSVKTKDLPAYINILEEVIAVASYGLVEARLKIEQNKTAA